MPIKKRELNLQAPAIVPAGMTVIAKPYEPSSDAILSDVPREQLRACSYITYQGADPMVTPIDDLATMMRHEQNDSDMDRTYRNRVRGKASGIRAFCVLCAGGSKGARMCSVVTCALWSFRMGNNPLNRK